MHAFVLQAGMFGTVLGACLDDDRVHAFFV